jgi:hypothetical protein
VSGPDARQPGERATLVVHAARCLSMDDQRKAHAVAALRALLIPHLRDRLAVAGRLDTAVSLEASSDPRTTGSQ